MSDQKISSGSGGIGNQKFVVKKPGGDAFGKSVDNTPKNSSSRTSQSQLTSSTETEPIIQKRDMKAVVLDTEYQSRSGALVAAFKKFFAELITEIKGDIQQDIKRLKKTEEKTRTAIRQFLKENKNELNRYPDALKGILSFVGEKIKDGFWAALVVINELNVNDLLKAGSRELEKIVAYIHKDLMNPDNAGTEEGFRLKVAQLGTLCALELKGLLTEVVGVEYAEAFKDCVDEILSDMAEILKLKGYEFVASIPTHDSAQIDALKYVLKRRVKDSNLKSYTASLGNILNQPLSPEIQNKILDLLLDKTALTHADVIALLGQFVVNQSIDQTMGNRIAKAVKEGLSQLKGTDLNKAASILKLLAENEFVS